LRFSGLILENVLMGFLSSSCRETAKNVIQKNIEGEKRQENGFVFLICFGKKFSTWTSAKNILVVFFELPLLRNPKKNRTKKKKKGTHLPHSAAISQIYAASSLSFSFQLSAFFSSAPLGPWPWRARARLPPFLLYL
jgi:hypothetical protein